MPHTRTDRFRGLMETAESREIPQMQSPTSNMGWNDYLDWNTPGTTYYPGSLEWFPSEGAASDQAQPLINPQSPTAAAVIGLPEPDSEKMPHSTFCGLHPWYSSGTQDFLSTSSTATARSQLSGSESDFYTSLDEESQPTDQWYGSPVWSPNISRQLSSTSDGSVALLPFNSPTFDLTQEPDDTQSYSSSKDEEPPGNTTSTAMYKKRKIAHSVVEKNYRTRINDGMNELRHCVPSRSPPPNSTRHKSPQSTPTGKAATLCDAVQYVRSLELANEGLQGRLGVMKLRNNTLQKIALSKGEKLKVETDGDDSEAHGQGHGSRKSRKCSREPDLAWSDGTNSSPGRTRVA